MLIWILVFIVNLIISLFLFYITIKIFKKKKIGQVVRDDGPETHLKKNGIPTMGGIVFLIVLLIYEIIFCTNTSEQDFFNIFFKMNLYIILFSLIGLIDDLLKVTKKNTKGLKSIIKLLLQILVASLSLKYCFNIMFTVDTFIFIFLVFIIVGTDNGVNFTDGIDGLCTLVTIIISIFYIIISYKKGYIDMIILNIILLAVLFAFLFFNHYPAKIFMGDAGSLLLGGYVSLMAIRLNTIYYLPIYGFIYMIEVISVIMQVSYFKMTKGKRIFKMAPIHHHFEKCGFSEKKICLMFSVVTIFGCIITYIITGV